MQDSKYHKNTECNVQLGVQSPGFTGASVSSYGKLNGLTKQLPWVSLVQGALWDFIQAWYLAPFENQSPSFPSKARAVRASRHKFSKKLFSRVFCLAASGNIWLKLFALMAWFKICLALSLSLSLSLHLSLSSHFFLVHRHVRIQNLLEWFFLLPVLNELQRGGGGGPASLSKEVVS